MSDNEDSDDHNRIVARNQITTGGNAVVLVDATVTTDPKRIADADGYYFFGIEAPEKVEGLSSDWLTEIIAGKDQAEADAALGRAETIATTQPPRDTNRLKLSLDYSCTEGGKAARIVRHDSTGTELKWNYLVVDAEDAEENGVKLTVAREIWLSSDQVLFPKDVDGKPLLGRAGTIDGAEIAKRIQDAHP